MHTHCRNILLRVGNRCGSTSPILLPVIMKIYKAVTWGPPSADTGQAVPRPSGEEQVALPTNNKMLFKDEYYDFDRFIPDIQEYEQGQKCTIVRNGLYKTVL